jgi:hypothetical protein
MTPAPASEHADILAFAALQAEAVEAANPYSVHDPVPTAFVKPAGSAPIGPAGSLSVPADSAWQPL